jgi:hypothetical protein
MSAFLCSDKHIFELAKYYVEKCQQYAHNKMQFREAAELLYNANCKSLAARYGDEKEEIEIPINYVPTIDNIFVLAKQVDCFTYQACEYAEWEDSKAYEMCESIKSHLLSNHPDYEVAPWGID